MLFKAEEDVVDGGTNTGIFLGEGKNLLLSAAVGMGIFSAGFGTVLIDGAVVIGAQERTGNALQHLIAFFIGAEILGFKISRFHAEVARQPIDVFIGKEWSCGFAAVGALEAICIGEDLLVCMLHLFIQIAWFLAFQLFDELLKLFLSLGAINERRWICCHGLAKMSTFWGDSL